MYCFHESDPDSRPPPVSFSPPKAPPISAPEVPIFTFAIPQSLPIEDKKVSAFLISKVKIAEVKRNIDGFNQNRNDWIEKIDDYITDQLDELGIKPEADARLNTETPGSVIDRLSILALRIYHMEEQAGREDATDEHREKAQQKLAVCFLQMDNLSQSLQELIDDIYAGKMAHRTYRQFKMYNDPTMNPYLYKAQQRLAG
mgnify:CR=1 FL=1